YGEGYDQSLIREREDCCSPQKGYYSPAVRSAILIIAAPALVCVAHIDKVVVLRTGLDDKMVGELRRLDMEDAIVIDLHVALVVDLCPGTVEDLEVELEP